MRVYDLESLSFNDLMNLRYHYESIKRLGIDIQEDDMNILLSEIEFRTDNNIVIND